MHAKGTLAHLHARDVTLAYFCEGTYEESRPYADFMSYTAPWYSARDAGHGLLAGRDFGWLGCYVRDDHDRVYETYWATDRGNEAGFLVLQPAGPDRVRAPGGVGRLS